MKIQPSGAFGGEHFIGQPSVTVTNGGTVNSTYEGYVIVSLYSTPTGFEELRISNTSSFNISVVSGVAAFSVRMNSVISIHIPVGFIYQ